MKDVENLFERLGTRSDYKDFGSKMLDDVRLKWPLLNDVSESEKQWRDSTTATRPVLPVAELPDMSLMNAMPAALPHPVVADTQGVEFKEESRDQKLPVRAFVSKKPQPASSVRDIFKSIGKPARLSTEVNLDASPAVVSATASKGHSLFSGKKRKDDGNSN